jgi:NTP pyrophosphatase (non-canonical NTP hydrolase)
MTSADGVIPIEELQSVQNDPFRYQAADILTELSLRVHDSCIERGFYEKTNRFDHQVIATKIALIHSEVSELLEAYRREPTDQCDKNIALSCEQEELADIIIRTLDLAAFRGVNIGTAIMCKLAFDKTRPFKHGKNF